MLRKSSSKISCFKPEGAATVRAIAAAPRQERRILGILLMIAATLCFTCIDSSAKWLGKGLPVIEIVFIRYFGHLICVSALYLPVYGVSLLRSSNPGVQLRRGFFLLSSTLLNFAAVQFLPLATTSAIQFTSPLWISILSIFLLGEVVGWRRWTAIAIGFVGVLVVVRPGLDAFHPASLLSVATAVAAALYFIDTRRLTGIDATATQQFHAAALPTLVFAPLAAYYWQWPQGTANWFAFIAIGFWGWAGHQLATVALRFAPASVVAPFTYFQIVPMVFAGYLLFGDQPDFWVYVGAIIVIVSGLFVLYRQHALARRAEREALLPPANPRL